MAAHSAVSFRSGTELGQTHDRSPVHVASLHLNRTPPAPSGPQTQLGSTNPDWGAREGESGLGQVANNTPRSDARSYVEGEGFRMGLQDGCSGSVSFLASPTQQVLHPATQHRHAPHCLPFRSYYCCRH